MLIEITERIKVPFVMSFAKLDEKLSRVTDLDELYDASEVYGFLKPGQRFRTVPERAIPRRWNRAAPFAIIYAGEGAYAVIESHAYVIIRERTVEYRVDPVTGSEVE